MCREMLRGFEKNHKQNSENIKRFKENVKQIAHNVSRLYIINKQINENHCLQSFQKLINFRND